MVGNRAASWPWIVLGIGLVLLTGLGPVGQAVPLAPVEDPFTGYDRFHGIATDGSQDAWRDGELCLATFTWFTLELSIDAQVPPADPGTTLELVAPHYLDPWTQVEKRATATPGEPATLEVYQANGCVEFQVLGTSVEGAAAYTVACMTPCDGDWP